VTQLNKTLVINAIFGLCIRLIDIVYFTEFCGDSYHNSWSRNERCHSYVCCFL